MNSKNHRSDPAPEPPTIEAYMPLVEKIAYNVVQHLPACVDRLDLVQDGVIGLMDAIRRYVPSRGRFATFAAPRIYGAMMDALREANFFPRNVDAARRKVEAAGESLRQEVGREPTRHELLQRLNGRAAWLLDKASLAARFISLSGSPMGHRAARDDAGYDRIDKLRSELIADHTAAQPSDAPLADDLLALILRGLSRADRTIVVLYYVENLTMKEIGKVLDLSESRVSQMHSSIVQRLLSRPDVRRLRQEVAHLPRGQRRYKPDRHKERRQRRTDRNSTERNSGRVQGRAAGQGQGAARRTDAERGRPARPGVPAKDGPSCLRASVPPCLPNNDTQLPTGPEAQKGAREKKTCGTNDPAARGSNP